LAAHKGKRDLESFWKQCLRLARVLALGGSVVLYFAAGLAAALGLLLGAAVSVLRFHVRYRALLRGAPAGALVRLRLLGYAVSAAALGAAFAFRHALNPWTTAAGLLLMNASVIATELLGRDAEPRAGNPAGP